MPKEYLFNVSIPITMEEIIDLIYENIPHEEVVTFIRNLELEYANWDVTEELYKHFKKQHELFIGEEDEQSD